jgi:hypothetical protein
MRETRARTATSRPPRRDSVPIPAGAPGPRADGGRAPRPRPVPFAAHQLAEYVLAGALAGLSTHIAHSGLLLVAAGAFALLAITARGPLGLARVCGPRLHATLDIVVALAVAAAPLVRALRPDVIGIIVLEVAALGWLRLATLTRYPRAAPTRPADGVPHTTDGVTTDAVSLPSSAQSPAPGPAVEASAAPRSGASVARGLGMLAGRSARRLPEVEEKLHDGARRAGRQAARVQRSWRKPPS